MGYSDEYKAGGGKLDKKVEIQSSTILPDDGGGHQKTWATVKTVWASVKPMSGYESMIASQRQQEVSHRICIRFMAGGFDTNWRIKWGTRFFSVTSAINIDEADRYMDLKAMERAEKFFE